MRSRSSRQIASCLAMRRFIAVYLPARAGVERAAFRPREANAWGDYTGLAIASGKSSRSSP